MPLQLLTPQFAHLKGRLYSGNLSEIQYKIELALDRTACLIINLDLLEIIDASGAYMLYITAKKAKERNKEIILYCKKNKVAMNVFIDLGLHYSTTLPSLTSLAEQYQTNSAPIHKYK